MRAGFEHFFRPQPGEYQKLWADGLFVFDTNVLLDLYRYTKPSRLQLLECLKKLAPRLWLPHQVAEEFHRNRAEVIAAYESDVNKIASYFDAAAREIRKELNRKQPSITATLAETACLGLEKLVTDLRQKLREEQVAIEDDQIFAVLEEVYKDKVGPAYDEKRLGELYKEGKQRFDQKYPPGYKDKSGKPEPQCYGDYIWWSQLLDHNENVKKPVIIVTGESDEDFWQFGSGKTLGPRFEMQHEMIKRSGQRMLMYNPHQFLTYYQEFENRQINEEVLKEVEVVSRPVPSPSPIVLDKDGLDNLKKLLGVLKRKSASKDRRASLDTTPPERRAPNLFDFFNYDTQQQDNQNPENEG